jgi:hypothetical protein
VNLHALSNAAFSGVGAMPRKWRGSTETVLDKGAKTRSGPGWEWSGRLYPSPSSGTVALDIRVIIVLREFWYESGLKLSWFCT